MAKTVYTCSCGRFSTTSKARAIIHITVPQNDGKRHTIAGL